MNLTPPDPICKFCDNPCSGTCEEARELAETECAAIGHEFRTTANLPNDTPKCVFCGVLSTAK